MVLPYPQRICSNTLNLGLKLLIVSNSIYKHSTINAVYSGTTNSNQVTDRQKAHTARVDWTRDESGPEQQSTTQRTIKDVAGEEERQRKQQRPIPFENSQNEGCREDSAVGSTGCSSED